MEFCNNFPIFLTNQSSCLFSELHGYIVSLHSDRSKAGNDFIDATVKTSEKECRVVRIMKSSNANVTTEYLNHFKQAGEPVMFSKLSASNPGIYFFNSYRGSRIETSKVVNFTFHKDSLIPIAEICQQGAGTFDVIACIK